eukprot:1160422-Pelagomonas_calceolata.AAC.7
MARARPLAHPLAHPLATGSPAAPAGTLYNMLDTSCDRASFYHTCKATRIPQIQCQLRKACLFADISNSSSALVTSASIERAVESITHHPGTPMLVHALYK